MKTSIKTSYRFLNVLLKLSLLTVTFLVVITCAKDGDGDSTDDQIIRYGLTVSVNPAGSGTASPSSGTYKEGTVLSLQATASTGYVFKEWTGAVQSADNPMSITMNSNMNLTANFELLDSDGDGVADLDDDCPDTPPGENVDENGCTAVSAVYLDDNGITIKCYDWAEVGDTGVIDGVTYTVVDKDILEERVFNKEDVTVVCTSKVTDMFRLFSYSDFNQDIGSWDVSNVTDMAEMFLETQFNWDISAWDVGNVTTMEWMFMFSPFNQDIGAWDVSSVTNMEGMFSDAPFNQDIGAWDVSNVTTMKWMFEFSPFNQDISNWNVSSVTNMDGMFTVTPFNQPIGNWDVSSVVDMSSMFQGSHFNQPIENWNVSNVTNMQFMFAVSRFNQPIGNWDVSSVTDMSYMFVGAWGMGVSNPFNQDISSWDVSHVTDMTEMFKESELNQDLSVWNVDSVVNCAGFSESTPQWILPKPNFTNCNPN